MVRLIGDGGMSFYIKDFAVIPSYQYKGVGTLLLESLEKYIRESVSSEWAVSLELISTKEAVSFYKKKGFEEKALADLDIENMDNIITLTMHRAENVDDEKRVTSIVAALKELDDMNIIFPIHPRTKNTLKNFGLFDELNDLEHIHIIKPIGYLDFLQLTSLSSLILTDSGGLQEEAITLDVPALTLRYNTERPETVTAGGNILVGADKKAILENVDKILNDKEFCEKMKNAKNPYGDGDAAIKTVDAIEEYYNDGLLNITAPEDIMTSFSRKMTQNEEDITVSEFEKKENALIHMLFDGERMIFPKDDLNIKGMMISYDARE
jgi:UDP-N-acetylglucosamine 2-epimerase (non-hydrolysing)